MYTCSVIYKYHAPWFIFYIPLNHMGKPSQFSCIGIDSSCAVRLDAELYNIDVSCQDTIAFIQMAITNIL